jgi:hypothetical protein
MSRQGNFDVLSGDVATKTVDACDAGRCDLCAIGREGLPDAPVTFGLSAWGFGRQYS